RDGRGDAAGAAGGGQRDRGPAHTRLIAEPRARGGAPRQLVHGAALRALRYAEDRLRRGAAVQLPTHQAAGRGLSAVAEAGIAPRRAFERQMIMLLRVGDAEAKDDNI